MSDPTTLETLSHADLVRLISDLQRRLAELELENNKLNTENKKLRDENEALKRRSRRSAAPFSRDTPSSEPKKPGRKPGQGAFHSRPSPLLEELTEPPIPVPVLEKQCPDCGGSLEEHCVQLASTTDLPKVVVPEVRQYRVSVCRCSSCGKKVRGTHPDLASDQQGASANRLGPRVLAAAHSLHYGLGIPQRKVPLILKELTGLELTQGALTQDARRRLDGVVGERYKALREGIKDSLQVNTDDTGWRVNGKIAYLMVFKTDAAVVYQIRERHRNDEVRELIPGDYNGTMGCDRFLSYDAASLSGVKQQKCLCHVQNSISSVLEDQQGKQGGALASVFGKRLKELLQEGLVVWQDRKAGKIDEQGFKDRAGDVMVRLDHQLRDRELSTKGNQRLLDELGRHHDNGNLVRFLTDERVSPTNNAAERALRPAVIARKVSQCSKNEFGARAFEAFKSVTETLKLEGKSIFKGLVELFEEGKVTPKIDSG